MTLESLMTKKVVSVEPECPLAEVLNKLRAYRISCLVVCEEGVPLGLISERDVVGVAYNYVSGRGEERTTARELMSSSLITVNMQASLDEAIAVVEEHRIRHLPVIEDGQLVGLLTQTDLLRASLARR
jgi:CBS domain-containing protein